MRAKEIITEEMHDYHEKSMPGMKAYPTVDQYYDLYRFGIAMAASGHEGMKGEERGEYEVDPLTLSYTEVDEKIITKACSKMGVTAVQKHQSTV